VINYATASAIADQGLSEERRHPMAQSKLEITIIVPWQMETQLAAFIHERNITGLDALPKAALLILEEHFTNESRLEMASPDETTP
jgi:hypothetical protein